MPTSSPSHVLVVDDDANMLKAMRRLLATPEATLHCVRGSREALDWLDQGHVPAAVVCDQSMPGMLGLELLERIRHRHSDAVLILYTGVEHLSLRLHEGTWLTIVHKLSEPRVLQRLVWAAVGRGATTTT
jgi:two-component system, LytTR family, response regulator LytT